MTSAPTVSVIIPVFNSAHFLAAAIQSALGQTSPPAEIIVVDDGSSDASGDIAKGYGIRVIRQPNRGVSAARNSGIAVSTGGYLAFLDADDLWLPQKLERQVQESLRASADICLTYITHRLEDGVPRPRWVLPHAWEHPIPGYSPSTWMVRRPCFETVGLFNEAYRFAEDWDWFQRARKAELVESMVEEALVIRRIHDANLSSNLREGRSSLLRVLRASLRGRESQ